MTAAKKSWMSFPDCQVATDKQRTQYLLILRSKWKMHQRFSKETKSESQDIWIRLPKHKWSKIMIQYGRPSRQSWAKSVWSSFGKTVMGNSIWEDPIATRWRGGFQLAMLIRTPWKRIILICVCGWHKNWLERNKTLIRCGKYSWKTLIWENQLLSLIMYTWDVLKHHVKKAIILWTPTEPCFNREFPWEELKNFHTPRIFEFLRGPSIWKVMPRNVWKDILRTCK